MPRSLASALVFVVAAFAQGCTTPSAANIALRKENQQLHEQIDQLTRAREADALTIGSLEAKTGTLPTLPTTRLAQLFTAQGLKLGRLTGGADLDPERPGDEALKIYVIPIDQSGGSLKAAGDFTVEAFDLAMPADPLIGRWTFSAEEAAKDFYDTALLYTFVLTCPWQKPPQHADLTVRVTFKDLLTQRTLPPVQKVVHVNLPPTLVPAAATGPTAKAAAAEH